MSQETCLENSVHGNTAKPNGTKANLNRVQELVILLKNRALQRQVKPQ